MLTWLLACSGSGDLRVEGDPVDTDAGTPVETDVPDLDTAPVPDTALPGPTGDTGAPPPPPFAESTHTEAWNDTLAVRTNVPRDAAACSAVTGLPCEDLDADGLADRWEALVLEALVPLVRFDESEPFVDDPDAVLAGIGRVVPAGTAIRAFVVLAYHDDYGRCGLSAHHGDSERVALDLSVLSDTDVGIVGAYTAAHENTGPTDHSTLYQGAALAELGFEMHAGALRWVVYASDGKHATYATVQQCETVSFIPCLDEDCAPDGVADPAAYERLPPVHNAGEPAAPMLTALDAIGFPGEQAWVDQAFCGGLGGSGCSGSIRGKLTDDPFP